MNGTRKAKSVTSGIVSALTTTKTAKDDIPSLFALASFATPLPLGMQAGYAVGRIISSKSTTKILKPERMLYIQIRSFE